MSRPGTPLPLTYRHGSSPSARPPTPTSNSYHHNLSSASRTSGYSLLSSEEIRKRLKTSLLHGLSHSDAEARLLDYGPNELPHEEPEPLWLRFLKQFKETLILLLLASAVVSFLMGNLDDAISIAIAVTIVVTVGFVQEYRSEESLNALNKLVPYYAHLVRAGSEHRTRSEAENGVPSSTNGEPKIPSANVPPTSTTVQASRLVPGDLVVFSTGDRIPADLRIVAAADLSIDESNLTGENEPTMKQSEPLDSIQSHSKSPASERSASPPYASPATGTVGADIRLNEQTNIAFMGTLVRSGHGQGLVIGTGANTEFGAISTSLQGIESPRTPLQLSMDRLGQELSYMSFAVIAVIMLVGVWQGRQWLEMFTIGVSLAVAAIPEGLPIIVTVTLALGVLRMAKRSAIIRKLPSVETLGSVDVVCSDKTGTLTLNHMTVTKLWYVDSPEAMVVNKDLLCDTVEPAVLRVLRIGNIANNARLSANSASSPATASSAAIMSSTLGYDAGSQSSKSRWVGQPTDVAILDLLDALGEDDVRDRIGDRTSETPFSSERKWMGVVIGGSQNGEYTGSQEVAYMKGALEQVLKRCDTYLSKEGREIILDERRRQMAIAAAEEMAQQGLRVLGFASGSNNNTSRRPSQPASRAGTPHPPMLEPSPSRQVNEDSYEGLVFAGIVGMNDPPRKNVDKSIRKLMQGGVKIIMITGDAETTAVTIARHLGMPLSMPPPGDTSTYRPVLCGDELDRMSEAELASVIAGTSVFARTSPEHKMKIVRALQSKGHVVAMTGDGVNDAPALKKADIGISMGLLGTDVAKEAADMILTDDDFSTILRAIEEGKGIFYNIQNFLTFQLSTSVAALSLVLLSTFFGLKNPLNAMQILWISEFLK